MQIKMVPSLILVLAMLAGAHAMSSPYPKMNDFIPTEYCKWCMETREGSKQYDNPVDHSTYYTCKWDASNQAQATLQKCAPCTYWDQEDLSCVSYSVAKQKADAAGNDVPFTMRFAYGRTCKKYVQCQASGAASIDCCEGDGFGFDADKQECVADSGCEELCVDPKPLTTEKPKVVELEKATRETCFYNQWEYEAGESGSYYWLLINGKRFQRLPCTVRGHKFDLVSCRCSGGEVKPPACLDLGIDFNGRIGDRRIFINKGSVKIVGKKYGGFDGTITSTLQIAKYQNYQFGSTIAISVWFKSVIAQSDKTASIVSNGDCEDKGSVNIWVKNNIVYGGVRTEEEASVMSTMISGEAEKMEWHHVVLTTNDGTVYFYVDNKLVGSKRYSGEIVKSHSSLTIGGQLCQDSDEFCGFQGLIDEFRYYKCSLSKDDVDDLYTKQSAEHTPE